MAALGVTLTMLGILAIGRALAAAAPPEWKLGELLLLAASIFLLREYIGFREAVKDIRRCRDPWAGAPAGFARSIPYARAVPREDPGAQGFEHAPPSPRAAAGKPIVDTTTEISADASVEEIAHVMVTQAFRKVSLKYHPDHGGDPEIMRRVYAAREMMLRAIRKN